MMNIPLFSNRLTVFDGAIGTEIGRRKGEDIEGLPDELNVTHPELVRETHRAYLQAGADFITTNTFSSNPERLARSGSEEEAETLCEKGARLAKEAVEDFGISEDGRPLVAGSLGPTGLGMTPAGELTFGRAYEGFRKSVVGLIAGGVDLIIVETMESLREAKAALLAAKEQGHPVAVSMAYGEKGKTSYGVTPEAAAVTLASLGPDMLSANCGTGPAHYPNTARAYARETDLPLLIEPNAGTPQLSGGSVTYEVEVEEFIEKIGPALSYLAAVGSCCGSTPQYTRSLRELAPDFEGYKVEKEPQEILKVASRSSTFSLQGEPTEPLQVDLADGGSLAQARKKLAELEGQLLQLRLVPSQGDKDLDDLEKKFARSLVMLGWQGGIAVQTDDPQGLEALLRAYPGRASVRGVDEEGELARIARRYGAHV